MRAVSEAWVRFEGFTQVSFQVVPMVGPLMVMSRWALQLTRARTIAKSRVRSTLDCGSLLPLFFVRQPAAGDELLFVSRVRGGLRNLSGASKLAPESGSELPQSMAMRATLAKSCSCCI